VILAIEREWGKYPGWFNSLEREHRARLLADWQIRQKPKDQKHKPQVKRIGRYR
jgi:hypothetical protein